MNYNLDPVKALTEFLQGLCLKQTIQMIDKKFMPTHLGECVTVNIYDFSSIQTKMCREDSVSF